MGEGRRKGGGGRGIRVKRNGQEEYEENGSGRIEEDNNIKKGGMTQSLKPRIIKMKQEDTGRFMGGDNDNDTSTGHVRGLIMGFEMMESGDDLKRINELKFRESLENTYQSPEKQRRV